MGKIMERDLQVAKQAKLFVVRRLLCRLNIHKWSYSSEVTRVCVCGCRQQLNEEDARDWAELNWIEDK